MAEALTNNNVNGGQTEDLSKAAAFFSRAQEVASTDNFDYAIDLFIEGLQRAPDAVDEGHKLLRYTARVRQAKGGKKPSVIEKMKYSSKTKNPIENMLNAEYLLAKDPDNLNYAEQMLNSAIEAGFKKTALWVADSMFDAIRASDKPSISALLLLKDAYAMMEHYEKAVRVCGYALKLKPDDAVLAGEYKNLSARLTMQKGKYDQPGGDFRDSIKDREEQEKLQMQQVLVKSVDVRQQAVDEARKAYEANKSLHTLFKLTDLMSDLQNDSTDLEAIDMLEQAWHQSKDFNYKKRAGELKLRMLRRQVRQAKESLTAGSGLTQEDVDEKMRQLLAAELEHYKLCMENYPTDLRFKYEYGLRLMRNQRYDEAIPCFQAAKKDPKYKIQAMNKIGLCFFVKGWFADAVDTLKEAVEEYEIKDDDIAKELRYNLARAYEQNGQNELALELYRRIAQIDFSYKDVKARINRLRQT